MFGVAVFALQVCNSFLVMHCNTWSEVWHSKSLLLIMKVNLEQVTTAGKIDVKPEISTDQIQ